MPGDLEQARRELDEIREELAGTITVGPLAIVFLGLAFCIIISKSITNMRLSDHDATLRALIERHPDDPELEELAERLGE